MVIVNTEIQKLFVPAEIAKQAVELGFNHPCIAYWSKFNERYNLLLGKFETIGYANTHNNISFEFIAPTYQQISDWLRIEKYIDIYVRTECNTNEILGYTGIIHAIMGFPVIKEYIGDDEYDVVMLEYYEVYQKTIIRALLYIRKNEKMDKILATEAALEAMHLKHHATADEIKNLNFESFDPTLSHGCIYGQLTGGCHSQRAKRLLTMCGYPYSTKINEFAEPSDQDFQKGFHERKVFVVGHHDIYSALEFTIFNYPETRKHVIDFLKSEESYFEL